MTLGREGRSESGHLWRSEKAMRRLSSVDSMIPGLCLGHAAASGPPLMPHTGSLAKASQRKNSLSGKALHFQFPDEGMWRLPQPQCQLSPAQLTWATAGSQMPLCVSPLCLGLHTRGQTGNSFFVMVISSPVAVLNS